MIKQESFSTKPNSNNNIEKSKIIITCSLLLIFFFFPWIKFLGITASAWDILEGVNFMNKILNSSNSNTEVFQKTYTLYLIPVLSLGMIYKALTGKNDYFILVESITVLIIFNVLNRFLIELEVDSKYIGFGFWGTLFVSAFYLFDILYKILFNFINYDRLYRVIMKYLIFLFFTCLIYAIYSLFLTKIIS